MAINVLFKKHLIAACRIAMQQRIKGAGGKKQGEAAHKIKIHNKPYTSVRPSHA
jgi:hypothetical protein